MTAAAAAAEPTAPRIEQAVVRGDSLELHWSRSRPNQRFTLLWLRDHCRCSLCHHPDTRQRLHDTFAISPDLSTHVVAVEDAGQTLRIDWAPQQHTSRYTAGFLAALQVDPEVLPVGRRLWDAQALARDVPAVPYEGLLARDEVLRDFLEHVESDGFAFVEGTPATPEAIMRAIRATGAAEA